MIGPHGDTSRNVPARRGIRGGGVHRGFGWELGRSLAAVALSSLLGVLFGALCGVGLGFSGQDVGAAAACGGVIGFGASPALIAVMTSAAAGAGVLVVTFATGVAALIAGSLGAAYDKPGWATIGTVACYGVACVGWRVLSGSGAWKPWDRICSGCGYDLLGLHGRCCPECGLGPTSGTSR